jgi:NAD/NADP transhydrogenase alpha subunit
VEGVVLDEETIVDGVRIIGIDNLPGEVGVHASQMLSSNMVNLFAHLYDSESGTMKIGGEGTVDEIAAGCVVVRGGAVVHPGILDHYKK